MTKNYLLVGLTGHGKSTTGNVLYNESGEIKSILGNPFATSDSASGCTRSFQMIAKENIHILDTVGFGDPQFSKLNNFNYSLFRIY